jgi:hypothetical protein
MVIGGVELSVAWTVNELDPVCCGAPLNTPPPLKLIPEGGEPCVTVQVIGLIPFVKVSVVVG